MSVLRLIIRSAWFHWRTQSLVMLGVCVATAVLVGALAVGDSVEFSLSSAAQQRIGRVDVAMPTGDRLFRAALAEDIAAKLNAKVAPVLQLRGTTSNDDGTIRRNQVQIIGVDHRFFQLAPDANTSPALNGGVLLNERLAHELRVSAGDEVVLRFERASAFSREAPLARDADATVAARLPVAGVLDASQFGTFSLTASHLSPRTIFVSMAWLNEQLEQSARANLLLVGGATEGVAVRRAETALRQAWKIDDVGLMIARLSDRSTAQITSDRIFMDDALGEKIQNALGDVQRVFTYFAIELRHEDRITPYSFVAGVGGGLLSIGNLEPDQVIVNQWLADDLRVDKGDQITLAYWQVGPGRTLREREVNLTVQSILPMQDAAIDPAMMPRFPGMDEADNCRDWEAGVPIDYDRIRDQDEAYWDAYRGTPKAFVTLPTAQQLWGSRFGELTALRYELRGNTLDDVAAQLQAQLDPASFGLSFVDVRTDAYRSVAQSLDFAPLFVGFSFFLIVAALLLTTMLFTFMVEGRLRQIGLLRAVGCDRHRVARWLMAETALVAWVGVSIGGLVGLVYTKLLLWALVTVWRGAVNTTSLVYHFELRTLLVGQVIIFTGALLTAWWATHRNVRQTSSRLIAGGVWISTRSAPRRWSFALAIIFLLMAIGLAMRGGVYSLPPEAAFFGAGVLMLLAGWQWCVGVFSGLQQRDPRALVSLRQLAVHGLARRSGRSTATVMLMAAGVFLTIAIGANRVDVLRDADKRFSGTGGFALYAESTLPILNDLNTPRGRASYALDGVLDSSIGFVNLRAHQGDDASCFNLTRAQSPRLLGVDQNEFASRGAFSFLNASEGVDATWALLDWRDEEQPVPAVVDEATLMWGLARQVGDVLTYQNERGETFQVRIVGMMANSVLQGSVLISREAFDHHFPGTAGFHIMLIDTPADQAASVQSHLSRALGAEGLEVLPAPAKLASFTEVANTYLDIFLLLGAMGVVLGSAGLGVVLMRNVAERSGELALLRAVGYERSQLRSLIRREHLYLAIAGVMVGATAALVAVLPVMLRTTGGVPYGTVVWSIAAILLSAVGWTIIATRLALSRPLITALRND